MIRLQANAGAVSASGTPAARYNPAIAGAVPASRPDPERLRRFGGDTIGLGLAIGLAIGIAIGIGLGLAIGLGIGIAIGIGTWARGHVSGKLARLRHSGLQNGFLSCHMGESTTAPAPRHPSV